MTVSSPLNEEANTSSSDRVAGYATFGTTFAISFIIVACGEIYVHSQITDSFLGDSFWPLSATIGALFTLIGGFMGLMVALGMINSIGEPTLVGMAEYSIIRIAGLLGTLTGILASIVPFVNTSSLIGILTPTGSGGSVLALLSVAGPTSYVFFQFYRPSGAHSIRGHPPQRTMDPEVVREKGEIWSKPVEQRTTEISATESHNSSKPQKGATKSNGSSHADEDQDWSEFEFRWITETGVTFDDIGGMKSLKRELTSDVIKPLTTHKEKADDLGVSPPNIIFHGPPGTGKTYLAKGLATELGLPFTKLSGADVQSKWINESSQQVSKLFEEAREIASNEGGAIVFIDELDSVLKSRRGGRSHNEDKKVVNEFLNNLEDTIEHNIVFIGATNRLDALDEAGIRAGRIDKKIHIGEPDAKAREAILHAQLADREHALTETQIRWIASNTQGFVAADLEQRVRQAASNVLARNGDTITLQDMREAFD